MILQCVLHCTNYSQQLELLLIFNHELSLSKKYGGTRLSSKYIPTVFTYLGVIFTNKWRIAVLKNLEKCSNSVIQELRILRQPNNNLRHSPHVYMTSQSIITTELLNCARTVDLFSICQCEFIQHFPSKATMSLDDAYLNFLINPF